LAFTMPSGYSLDSLPQPNDGGVHLVPHAGSTVAVMSFSGRNTPGKADRIETKLRTAIQREGHQPLGPGVLALYDNPWTTLPFLRRNELHIKIALT
jgi:hypothetical protein